MRNRGLHQRLGAWVVAALIMGVCATGAHAQVQFSAWPVCDDGDIPLSLQSWIWDDGGGAEGRAAFQPIPAKTESYQVASLAVAAIALGTLTKLLDSVPANE